MRYITYIFIIKQKYCLISIFVVTEGVEPGAYGHHVDAYAHRSDGYYDFLKGNGTVELYDGNSTVATLHLPEHSEE